jgi:hypothetical protein
MLVDLSAASRAAFKSDMFPPAPWSKLLMVVLILEMTFSRFWMRFSSWVSFAQVEGAGTKVVVTRVVVAVDTEEDELTEAKNIELALIPQKRRV